MPGFQSFLHHFVFVQIGPPASKRVKRVPVLVQVMFQKEIISYRFIP